MRIPGFCPLQMAAVGRANSNRKPEVLVFGRKAVFLWDVENFHEFHDCSEQRDRMEMLRIFQVAAVFFGILWKKSPV